MSGSVPCTRCGYANVAGTRSCASCGLPFAPSAPVPRSQNPPTSFGGSSGTPRNTASVLRPPFPHGFRTTFLDRLEGTVIAVGPEGYAPRKRSAWKGLLAVGAILLLPVLICTAIALRFMGWGKDNGGMTQHLLLLNLPRLFAAPPETIPTWDLRIRDQSGQEHAARLEGRDSSGPPAPGDRVVLWGRIVHGTMAVAVGFNERTRSWMYL